MLVCILNMRNHSFIVLNIKNIRAILCLPKMGTSGFIKNINIQIKFFNNITILQINCTLFDPARV